MHLLQLRSYYLVVAVIAAFWFIPLCSFGASCNRIAYQINIQTNKKNSLRSIIDLLSYKARATCRERDNRLTAYSAVNILVIRQCIWIVAEANLIKSSRGSGFGV